MIPCHLEQKEDMNQISPLGALVLVTSLGFFGNASAAEDSYYKSPTLFSTAPNPEKSLQSIDRFGPVGMGIELIQPAFTMRIKNIEEGSPAAETGKLKPGRSSIRSTARSLPTSTRASSSDRSSPQRKPPMASSSSPSRVRPSRSR